MNGKRNDEWEGVIFVKNKCRLNFSFYAFFNMDSNLETKILPRSEKEAREDYFGKWLTRFFVIFYNMTLNVFINIIDSTPYLELIK